MTFDTFCPAQTTHAASLFSKCKKRMTGVCCWYCFQGSSRSCLWWERRVAATAETRKQSVKISVLPMLQPLVQERVKVESRNHSEQNEDIAWNTLWRTSLWRISSRNLRMLSESCGNPCSSGQGGHRFRVVMVCPHGGISERVKHQTVTRCHKVALLCGLMTRSWIFLMFIEWKILSK